MMMLQDDFPLETSPYHWSKDISEQPLSDYLAKVTTRSTVAKTRLKLI